MYDYSSNLTVYLAAAMCAVLVVPFLHANQKGIRRGKYLQAEPKHNDSQSIHINSLLSTQRLKRDP